MRVASVCLTCTHMHSGKIFKFSHLYVFLYTGTHHWLLAAGGGRGGVKVSAEWRHWCLPCDLADDIRAETVACAGKRQPADTHTHTLTHHKEKQQKSVKTLISYFPVVSVKLTFSIPVIL